jgi:phosphatidylglycerol lysyltransferase
MPIHRLMRRMLGNVAGNLRQPALVRVSNQPASGESAMSARQFAAEQAFVHGRTYDSYLMAEDDREYFWSADRRNIVGYVRHGRHLHVTGNLAVPGSCREGLLRELVAFAIRNRLVLCIYNVFDEDLAMFRRRGFQLTKWGEEPIIELREATWTGKPYEWLRRQEHGCRRQGVVLRELGPAGAADELPRLVSQMRQLNQEHLRATPQGKEMQVLEGRFTLEKLGHRRLFIAEHEDRLEAIIVLNPALAGRMWAFDIYRRRADAPPGVIPFAMLQVMRQLKEEGVEYASLSMIPALRTDAKRAGDCRLLRRGTVFWRDYLGWLFDMKGLYHYKSRFRPAYRNLYVAAYPRQTVGSLVSLLRCWGVLRIEPWCLARSTFARLNGRAARQQLSCPPLWCEKVFPAVVVSPGFRSQGCTG